MALDEQSTSNRREDVLRAAAIVFSDKGYRASTIQDIGQALGITSAALYYYFESKQEILSEIIMRPLVQLIDMADEVARSSRSDKEKLAEVIRRHIAMMLSKRELFTILLRERVELSTKDAKRLADLEERYYQKVRAIVTGAVDKKEAREVNSRVAALALIGMINWVLRWYRPDGPLTEEEIASNMSDIFFHGILANSSGKKSKRR